jgi:large subunit ribosomal protein L3
MITGLWGKKLGMTQVFASDMVVPVTVVDVSCLFVTNIRTQERDGYDAVQIGRVKDKFVNKKFDVDWIKKPKKYFSVIKELKLKKTGTGVLTGAFIVGQPLDIIPVLNEGDKVDAFGTSKGRGFQGVMKRHNFNGSPGSHGSTIGKRPGANGFMRSRGRVIKGKKLPGQFGNCCCVSKNLQVIRVEKESKIVFVKGAVPGRAGSFVFLRREKVT